MGRHDDKNPNCHARKLTVLVKYAVISVQKLEGRKLASFCRNRLVMDNSFGIRRAG
jgi:hypothetical protein